MRAYVMVAALMLGIYTPTVLGQGVIVAAGGGSEGDIGDTTAWSYPLYKALVDNGDINGDAKISVAILSTGVEDGWLPSYFQWLGADSAFNVRVTTRSMANDPAVVDVVKSADVVFLKGGDQGVYYDEWNDSLLEDHIRYVVQTRSGAIGGTSAGAMSLSQYAFAGGTDLISLDVLTDAQTRNLDDTDGGSALHDDFLQLVAGCVIDTHYTTRARMGRLAGIMAKGISDGAPTTLVGIGIDERTGLLFKGKTAKVYGVGAVDFLQQTSATRVRRDPRKPLIYTNLREDRLIEGWTFDLTTRLPVFTSAPTGTKSVTYAGDGVPNSGSLTINGTEPDDDGKFEKKVTYAPLAYTLEDGTYTTFVRNSVGAVDAQDSDRRGAAHEALFRGLYDVPSFTGFLVADSGRLYRGGSTPDILEFQWNTKSQYRRAATIVIDGKTITHKGLSPYTSNVDNGSGDLNAAALIGATVHIAADSGRGGGPSYDTRRHQMVGGP